MIDLDAIEARANAATPKLRAEQIGDGYALQEFVEGEWRDQDGWVSVGRLDTRNKQVVFGEGDAKFFAAARPDVRALIAEVRRLRELMIQADNFLAIGLVTGGKEATGCRAEFDIRAARESLAKAFAEASCTPSKS